jgi:hypothetical protein
MDLLPVIETQFVTRLVPVLDTGTKIEFCNLGDFIDVFLCASSVTARDLRAEAHELMTFKGKQWMLAYSELNVIGFDLY